MKIRTKTDSNDYDKNKIHEAIEKAFSASSNIVSEDMLKDLVEDVTAKLKALNQPVIDREVVQDTIEEVLMAHKLFYVARTFIRYRYQHQIQKSIQSPGGLKSAFSKYLDKSAWEINENANMGYSLQGLYNNIVRSAVEKQWLEIFYPEKAATAYKEGYMHIHDLDALSVYCVGWDIQDLLLRGFGGVIGKVESKPPKHFDTALGQVVNFIFSLQNEAAGAQAFSNFDTYLAPFIYYDKLTYKEVKQTVQNFIFNMNVATRVGAQTPFSNITLDLVVPKHMEKMPVIIGGEYQKETFKEFQREMDIFNRAFFEVMMEGDASGRIFTFPIPTINITKNFDWDDKSMNLLWDITAKYGIAYFANYVNSDMSPEDSRSMCCRLRLSTKELHKRGGGLFGASGLTGSVGVVTLSLPMIAYDANGSVDKFYTGIAKYMDIAKLSLEAKRKILEELTDKGLYPFSKHYLENIKGRDGRYWSNHFSTIGLIGMYEAATMLGFDYAAPEGRKFAESVLKFMNKRLIGYQGETGNFYNLEATPAEGASYKLALTAKKMYPKILTSGKDAPYFTNSTMLPVNFSSDVFKVLEHQDSIQSLYTGGTVLHMYLGQKINGEQAKLLVKNIISKYKIPYLSITPTFSICPVHGYVEGEHPTCPKCLAEKTSLEERVKKLKEELK